MTLGSHKWPNKGVGIYMGLVYTEYLSGRSWWRAKCWISSIQEGQLQVQFDQSITQVSGQLRIREVQTNTASLLCWLWGTETLWQSHGGPRHHFYEPLHEELKEVKKYRKWFLDALWLLGRQKWYHWLLWGSALVCVGAYWAVGWREGSVLLLLCALWFQEECFHLV